MEEEFELEEPGVKASTIMAIELEQVSEFDGQSGFLLTGLLLQQS